LHSINHSVVDLANQHHQQEQQFQQVETKNAFNYQGSGTINWSIDSNDLNTNNKILALNGMNTTNNHASSLSNDQVVNNENYNFYPSNINRFN
jgi:hypothetical protein